MASFTLEQLDQYLSFKSYIIGYHATLADIAVFEVVSKSELEKSSFVNVKRWYKHISTYSESEKSKLSGQKTIPVEINESQAQEKKPAADDDFDLFGSDDEDEIAIKNAQKEAIKAKKQKPKVIAKSTVVFDVKPLGTEIDELKEMILNIQKDGLIWGETKLEDLCFGVKKLVISAEIEDDKVSMDMLEEEIVEFEDHVQSVDIVSFQKV